MCDKFVYPDKNPDKKAARSQLIMKRRRHRPESLREYFCHRCDGWHLTHQPKTMKFVNKKEFEKDEMLRSALGFLRATHNGTDAEAHAKMGLLLSFILSQFEETEPQKTDLRGRHPD